MQRQLSSFDINLIAVELKQIIVGCHIEKIYQLSRDEILIRVKNIKSKHKESIYVRNGNLICITNKQIQTPERPSTFAMALRKYLQNGVISEINQHEFDRIINLKISRKDGDYTLVIEFFSNGNIILVDPDGKIITPLIRQTWSHRAIKGREPYVPPPSQIKPFDFTFEQFKKALEESTADIVRTLAVNINLSGAIAEEICTRSNVDKKTDIKDLKNEEIIKIYAELQDFLKHFKEKLFEPAIVKKDEKIVDILPFKFKSYQGFNFEKTDCFTRGLENFIQTKKVETKKTTKKAEKLTGKLKRQLAQQEKTIEKFEKEIETKKLQGDLIYLNYQQIEDLLNEIKQVLDLKEKNDAILKINEKKIVKEFKPTDNILIANLKDTNGNVFDVKLDFRKTVSENAEKAYDDNKKIRNKLEGAKKSVIITREQIKSARVKEEKKVEKTKIDMKKEKMHWFERFRWFISSDGNIVVGGRDEKTNDLVVKKYLKEADRYAHADIQGAPSIVIKSKGLTDEKLDISEKTLEEACIFAASFSKAWKQFAEAQAYWVTPEQVSKTAQSGEFVPHGAFIIRGKRNYYQCKLELGVGLVEAEGDLKVMSGPVSAIRSLSDKFVVIIPGDVKKNVMAHKLGKVFDVPVDRVDRVLPPGGISIVETVGVKL